jgi:lipopolysaccharide/colanic/teichoic acid biosynthesis glycosyltransferase
MKRAFDAVCSLAGLVMLAPLLILIAAAVWVEDRHSPLFCGTRLARGGGEFRMVKFRTMVPDAWKTGVNSTAAGDRRITRVGALLRRTKLDELPQLWNVLWGDMSLVGPRPQVAAEVSLYTPVERGMLEARPGITDLASIVFADEGEILAGSDHPDLLYNQIIRPWKSRLALAWKEHSNLAWDLLIIGWTLVAAVSREPALRGAARILDAWDVEPMLARMARRRDPLVAWPPPGGTQIVAAYTRQGPLSHRGGHVQRVRE